MTPFEERQNYVESFRGIEKQPLEEERTRLMEHITRVYSIPIDNDEMWWIEQEKEISRLFAIKRELEIKMENYGRQAL